MVSRTPVSGKFPASTLIAPCVMSDRQIFPLIAALDSPQQTELIFSPWVSATASAGSPNFLETWPATRNSAMSRGIFPQSPRIGAISIPALKRIYGIQPGIFKTFFQKTGFPEPLWLAEAFTGKGIVVKFPECHIPLDGSMERRGSGPKPAPRSFSERFSRSSASRSPCDAVLIVLFRSKDHVAFSKGTKVRSS